MTDADPLLAFFDRTADWLAPAIDGLHASPDAVLAKARLRFDGMRNEIPYVNDPGHTMGGAMFSCAAILAVFEVLRESAVDTHAWGSAIHALPAITGDDESGGGRAPEDAAASVDGAAPNEFVFEFVARDEDGNGGMNIKSCAICHLFGRHDAMALVPYMCALDDVMSDAGGTGLRRTGTIALGASHCDFRFRPGDPLRLAEQYPDQIRLGDPPDSGGD
jgi:hypothetical protein